MDRSLALIFLLALSGAPCAACPAWGRLPVKLFNDADAGIGILNSAKSEAAWLLKSLCIEVVWVPCPVITVANLVPCQAPPGAIELHVISNTTSSDVTANSLGIALPNRVSRPAAVFLARVQRLAAMNDGIIDVGGLLGNVIAHEIGHLLLQSTAHSQAGLMRAEFSRSDLKKAAQRQLRFNNEQVESIRRSLLARRR